MDDWYDDDGDEDFDFDEALNDREEYAFEHETIRREVKEPMHVIVEAQICGSVDDSGEDTAHSFIQLWHVLNEKNKLHFFIDTADPEPVLNALEQRLADGEFHAVRNFIKTTGHTVRDPIEFRLKLDAVLGASSGALTFGDNDKLDF